MADYANTTRPARKPAPSATPKSETGSGLRHQFKSSAVSPSLIDHRNNPASSLSARAQLTDQRASVTQRKAQAGGLPAPLKSGIESLSGMSMDHVRVHYNSPQPAQLQAHAFAQGHTIHLAPGQEKHLPHEAWHVVQQAQGRVPVTRQMKRGLAINDNQSLEREADSMGARAMAHGVAQARHYTQAQADPASANYRATYPAVLQGFWPSLSQVVLGGAGALVGGFAAATAPISVPTVLTGAALGGALGGVLGTGLDYLTGAGETTPAKKTAVTGKAAQPGSGQAGNGQGQSASNANKAANSGASGSKAKAGKAITDELLATIAKSSENQIARDRAVGNLPKREAIYKTYAKGFGLTLSKAHLKKIDQIWKGNVNPDKPKATVSKAVARLPSGPPVPYIPRAVFDYDSAYATKAKLLAWVKKPNTDGTRDSQGRGSWKEHQLENTARGYAKQGKYQAAIDELNQAIAARSGNTGGQLAQNSGHQKAVTYLEGLVSDLESFV